MNNKFVNKLLDYLKDNTEIERYEKLPDINSVYDGYIIAPIGNGFRWDYYNRSLQEDGDFVNEFWIDMKEIYSLKDEEVMYVMGEYQDFIWDLLDKQQSNINETNTDKETINESWYYQYVLDHKFLNKVLEQFILETELPEEFLSKQGYSKESGFIVEDSDSLSSEKEDESEGEFITETETETDTELSDKEDGEENEEALFGKESDCEDNEEDDEDIVSEVSSEEEDAGEDSELSQEEYKY
jgi:hypothetical protein